MGSGPFFTQQGTEVNMSNSHKDNWRELAELLGLPIDEPAPAAPTPTPPVPAVPVKVEIAPPPPVEEYVPSVLDEPAPIELPAELDEFSHPEAGDEADASGRELAEGDDKPRDEKRGRRRGRRGRRRGRDEAPEGSEAPVASETPAEVNVAPAASDRPETDDDREQRRGRRRGARSEDADAEAPVATAVADVDADRDDDFSQDAWADWNVPSWQELIDGLHRPDR
jgi:hypothetical protein